jgi:MYXO-CTERM domain-containing protein
LTVASDPEELLRSIERTREELAHTVDTIAGRLDPKRAAKRGVDAVRDGVTTVVDGARVKLHLGPEPSPSGAAKTTTTAKSTSDAAVAAVSARLAQVAPLAKRVPKPAATGMAALVAFAAIVAARRRRR